MTALEIVELLGGVTAVSNAIGAPLTTVSSWGRFNQIPAWRQPKLLELAGAMGKVLSTADFPAPAERIIPSKAAA